jgi:hypothetical protein
VLTFLEAGLYCASFFDSGLTAPDELIASIHSPVDELANMSRELAE